MLFFAHSGTLTKVYQHSRPGGPFRAARPRNSLLPHPGLRRPSRPDWCCPPAKSPWRKAQRNGNQASKSGDFGELGISIYRPLSAGWEWTDTANSHKVHAQALPYTVKPDPNHRGGTGPAGRPALRHRADCRAACRTLLMFSWRIFLAESCGKPLIFKTDFRVSRGAGSEAVGVSIRTK